MSLALALMIVASAHSTGHATPEVLKSFDSLCRSGMIETIVARAKQAGWTEYQPAADSPMAHFLGQAYEWAITGSRSSFNAFYISHIDGQLTELRVAIDDSFSDSQSITCELHQFDAAKSLSGTVLEKWAKQPSIPIVLQVSPSNEPTDDAPVSFVCDRNAFPGSWAVTYRFYKATEANHRRALSGLHLGWTRGLAPAQ